MDCYAELGVRKDATTDAIRASYRVLAQRLHPDKGGSEPERFVRVQIAYRTLRDPAKRKRYDESGVVDNAQQDNRESFIRSQAAEVLLAVIDGCGEDPATTDIVQMARNFLRHKIQEINQQCKTAIPAMLERRRAVRKRMKRTDGAAIDEDLLALMLDHEIAKLEANAATLQEKAAVFQEVIEFFDAYGYTFERAATFAAFMTTSSRPW